MFLALNLPHVHWAFWICWLVSDIILLVILHHYCFKYFFHFFFSFCLRFFHMCLLNLLWLSHGCCIFGCLFFNFIFCIFSVHFSVLEVSPNRKRSSNILSSTVSRVRISPSQSFFISVRVYLIFSISLWSFVKIFISQLTFPFWHCMLSALSISRL